MITESFCLFCGSHVFIVAFLWFWHSTNIQRVHWIVDYYGLRNCKNATSVKSLDINVLNQYCRMLVCGCWVAVRGRSLSLTLTLAGRGRSCPWMAACRRRSRSPCCSDWSSTGPPPRHSLRTSCGTGSFSADTGRCGSSPAPRHKAAHWRRTCPRDRCCPCRCSAPPGRTGPPWPGTLCRGVTPADTPDDVMETEFQPDWLAHQRPCFHVVTLSGFGVPIS